jgi:hypothetical protein
MTRTHWVPRGRRQGAAMRRQLMQSTPSPPCCPSASCYKPAPQPQLSLRHISQTHRRIVASAWVLSCHIHRALPSVIHFIHIIDKWRKKTILKNSILVENYFEEFNPCGRGSQISHYYKVVQIIFYHLFSVSYSQWCFCITLYGSVI